MGTPFSLDFSGVSVQKAALKIIPPSGFYKCRVQSLNLYVPKDGKQPKILVDITLLGTPVGDVSHTESFQTTAAGLGYFVGMLAAMKKKDGSTFNIKAILDVKGAQTRDWSEIVSGATGQMQYTAPAESSGFPKTSFLDDGQFRAVLAAEKLRSGGGQKASEKTTEKASEQAEQVADPTGGSENFDDAAGSDGATSAGSAASEGHSTVADDDIPF